MSTVEGRNEPQRPVGAEGGPGPVAWVGIFTATFLMLLVLNHILWLVVPALMALLLSYALYPSMQRLIYAGMARESAAALVTFLFLIALVGAVINLIPQ